MCLKICIIISVALVLSSGQESNVSPTETGRTKETIYDIQLYISIPAAVIILGLFLCLCYCLLGSCKETNQHPITAFQPVVVTNRNSPVVVSAQSSSHNDPRAKTSGGTSVSYHQNRNNTQSTAQNANPVIGNNGKTIPPDTQRTAGQQSTQTNPVKDTDQPIERTVPQIQSTGKGGKRCKKIAKGLCKCNTSECTCTRKRTQGKDTDSEAIGQSQKRTPSPSRRQQSLTQGTESTTSGEPPQTPASSDIIPLKATVESNPPVVTEESKLG